MYKKISLSVFLFCTTLFYAQVGIGTTTPSAGAMLDIDSDSGGILIPRISLTSTSSQLPISPPAPAIEPGVMVFNIATINDVTPGFYYWNGSAWERMASGASTDWSRVGNAGTTPGTNFIGTTDNQALRIRTNNGNRFDFTTNGRLRSYNNGSAGQPTYSWNGDTNTGMFKPADDNLAFSTNGAERMRIIENGRIGINQNIPLGYMHVTSPLTGATGGPGIFSEISVTDSNWSAIEASNPNTSGGTGVTGAGFTGIRGNTTNLALGWAGFFNGDVGVTNDLYVGGAYNPSDIRIKKNFRKIENALSIINALNPTLYEKNIRINNNQLILSVNNKKNNPQLILGSNSSNDETEYGLIAQEVELLLPDLIKEKKMNIEGLGEIDLKSVNYTGLIPILIQGIQEQQAIIESQEARIARLEALVEKLIKK